MRETVPPHLAESECEIVAPRLVAGYLKGALPQAAAWSVEAHLPGCPSCRSVLAAGLGPDRLERNRAILMTRLALGGTGPAAGTLGRLSQLAGLSQLTRLRGLAGRAARRCGVPAHVWRLLSATPSLRTSWLVGVALTLAAAIGAARYLSPGFDLEGASAKAAALPAVLPASLPFLLLVPLLPLAGVAAAFHPRLDPTADLSTAAPLSAVWLYCVRSVAVIGATLIPAVLAAFALPSSGWLPLLIVLPALGVSVAALALATLIRPLPAALCVGAGWVVVVSGLALSAGSPADAFTGRAQPAWLAVVAAACALLAARHRKLELGWKR